MQPPCPRRRVRYAALALSLFAVLSPEASRSAPTRLDFRVEGDVWLLNGDLVRQPAVPLVQIGDFPTLEGTAVFDLEPTGAPLDELSFLRVPANLAEGAVVTLSRTANGAPLLVPNPTNLLDPFTARFSIAVGNQTGGITSIAGEIGGPVIFNLDTTLVLNLVDTGIPFFFADLPLTQAIGVPASRTFQATVGGMLDIPLAGRLHGSSWTTGPVAISAASLVTGREGDSGIGPPTAFATLRRRASGSATAETLGVITPLVVEIRAGTGPQEAPFTLFGFLRLTLVPEPRGAAGLAAAALVLLLARRRRAATSARGCRGSLPLRGSPAPTRR